MANSMNSRLLRTHPAGNACIAGVVTLIALMGMTSLVVDYGRYLATKAELQAAADAAAMYAVRGLHDNTAVAKAQAAASENRADTSSVALLASDVRVGQWNKQTKVFVAGATPYNAVEVTAHRISSRNNAVPLVFGHLIGKSSVDLSVHSVATTLDNGFSGFIGLNSITMNSTTVNSYDSAAGPYNAGSATSTGHIASNGTVSINSTTIAGKISMQSGQSLTSNSSSHGGRVALSAALSMPTDWTHSGGNLTVNSGTRVFSGGTYHYNKVTLNNCTVSVTAPTTIYIHHDLNVNSTVFNISSGRPGDLTIYAADKKGASFNSSTFRGDFYAPGRTVYLNSATGVYGRIIAGVLDCNSANLHYDTSLPAFSNGGGSSSGTILLAH